MIVPFEPYTFVLVAAVLGVCIGLRCFLLSRIRVNAVIWVWYAAAAWLILLLLPVFQFRSLVVSTPAVSAMYMDRFVSDTAVLLQKDKSAWAVWLWHIGAVLVGTGIVLLQLFSQYRMGTMQRVSPEQECELRRRFALPRYVRVCLCAGIEAPLMFGLLWPRLVLTPKFADLPLEEQKMVLAHEKAHLRRFDLQFKAVVLMLTALYWFHPLVWVMLWMVQKDVELCCDEAVLDEYGADSADTYQQLLKLFSGKVPAVPASAQSLGGGTACRLKHIVLYRRRGKLWTILVVVLMTAIFCCTGTLTPRRQPVERYAEAFDTWQEPVASQPVPTEAFSTFLGHAARHNIPEREAVLYTDAGRPWRLSVGDKVQLTLQLKYGQVGRVVIGYYDITQQQFVQIYSGKVCDRLRIQCPPIMNDCYFFIVSNNSSNLDISSFHIDQK